MQHAMRTLTTDGVCRAYVLKGLKIMVKPVPADPNLILIEGDEVTFEFLGKLFLAHAKAINGCGFQFGPKYAGNALFSKQATLGLYLHRLPCDNQTIKVPEPLRKSPGPERSACHGQFHVTNRSVRFRNRLAVFL